MKLLAKIVQSSCENVDTLLSTTIENAFSKETKPLDIEGGGVCVYIRFILYRFDKGIEKCDGK